MTTSLGMFPPQGKRKASERQLRGFRFGVHMTNSYHIFLSDDIIAYADFDCKIRKVLFSSVFLSLPSLLQCMHL